MSALLGEMTKVDGQVSIDGSVAYVAQTAWIINASLKDNVLMGRPLDEARYQRVLEVCDMKQVHTWLLRVLQPCARTSVVHSKQYTVYRTAAYVVVVERGCWKCET